MRKLMILFPGIGYHCDKPILYYGKKIVSACHILMMERIFEAILLRWKKLLTVCMNRQKNSSMEWNLISMMKFCLSLKV